MSQHEQEFQAFYEKHFLFVYRYIHSKIGCREEAEDLTARVFMKALKNIDYQRNQDSPQKWLVQVMKTTLADYWRIHYQISSHSLQQLFDAGRDGPVEDSWGQAPALQAPQESTPPSQESFQHVQQILQALPEHQREVLTCRFLLSLSIKETAQCLGLTETNVKVLQFRALKHAASIDLQYTDS